MARGTRGLFCRPAQRCFDAQVDQKQAADQANPVLLVEQAGRDKSQAKGGHAAIDSVGCRGPQARNQAIEKALLQGALNTEHPDWANHGSN